MFGFQFHELVVQKRRKFSSLVLSALRVESDSVYVSFFVLPFELRAGCALLVSFLRTINEWRSLTARMSRLKQIASRVNY